MSDIGDRIIELHQRGIPSLSIAHRLNVAQSTVHYHLRCLTARRSDTKAKQRARVPSARSLVNTREKVAQLLAEGISRIEISRRLEISKSTVFKH